MNFGSGYSSIGIRNEQEPGGGRFADKGPRIKGGGKRSYNPRKWRTGGNMQYPGRGGNRIRLHELSKDLRWGQKQAERLGLDSVDQLMYLYEQGF